MGVGESLAVDDEGVGTFGSGRSDRDGDGGLFLRERGGNCHLARRSRSDWRGGSGRNWSCEPSLGESSSLLELRERRREGRKESQDESSSSRNERQKVATYRVQPFRTPSELLLVETSIRVVEDNGLIPDLHVLHRYSCEELSVQPLVRLSFRSNESTSQRTEVGLRRVFDDDGRDLRVEPPLSVVRDLGDGGSVDSAKGEGRRGEKSRIGVSGMARLSKTMQRRKGI